MIIRNEVITNSVQYQKSKGKCINGKVPKLHVILWYVSSKPIKWLALLAEYLKIYLLAVLIIAYECLK